MNRQLVKAAAVSVLLFAAAALASVVIDRGPYVLKDTGTAYPTEDACVAAAQDGLTADPRTCEHTATVKGLCDDAPKPAEPERVLTPHLCPGDDTRYWFTEDHQVAVAYPKCWEVQAVVEANVCGPDPVVPNTYQPVWP